MSPDIQGGSCGDSSLASLARILSQRQITEEIPEGCDQDQEYLYLRGVILELRGAILATASGDLSFPISQKGYIPGALKALQAALRHLTWQTSAIAAGDFSQRVDFLGEFSVAFNDMVRQLEESVEKLKKSKEDLWLVAHTDTLTGMNNRMRFFELYEPLFALPEESGTSGIPLQEFAIIMLDIDHFKHVNDTYGHAAGDMALKSVAGSFKEISLPAGSFWGRIGGEEFALVVPVCLEEQALVYAEMLRKAIEQRMVVISGLGFGITASLGLCMRQAGDSPESLFSRVDAAMYRAKATGRNRVCQDSGCV